MSTIKLVKIPEINYDDYRYEVIFKGYKWDPQVEDANTISRFVAVLDEQTADELAILAEQLANETICMEEQLVSMPKKIKQLGFSSKMTKALKHISNYNRNDHVRLMRFDFHPTDSGWKISEVNSDVPGGFAESSILPEIATSYCPHTRTAEKFSDHLLQSYQKKLTLGDAVAFVHATSYSDDRQVMQFIGDTFEQHGYCARYLAPDHLTFEHHQAYSILGNDKEKISGIVRFFPLEWLPRLSRRANWQHYFSTQTPSCNHPIAMLTQPKSLPLIWSELVGDFPTWEKLLPQTEKSRPLLYQEPNYIYKPVFGRVGSEITINEVTSEKEFVKIRKLAAKHKKEWVVQERFNSLPIYTDDQQSFHLCIGVFVIDGQFAGFYGRISPYAKIDEKAQDIPILIQTKEGPK